MHRRLRIYAAATAVLAIEVLTGCSGGSTQVRQLSASSSCKDYLATPKDQQDVAVQQIAGDRHDGAALTPLGRPNIDLDCGNDQSRNLGSVIDLAAGKQSAAGSAGATSARPPEPVCSGACFTGTGKVKAVLAAAKADLQAVNTYSFRTLPADLAHGLAVTTGAERGTYSQTFRTVVSPGATKLHAAQTAQINAVGLQTLDATGEQATVLAAGQLTSTQQASTPRVDPFTETATLRNIGGRWLLSAVSTGADGQASPPGSPALASAVGAGVSEARNLGTYSRASFDADYNRALDGATGSLRTDLVSKEATTRNALVKGGFDLTASVMASAVTDVKPATVQLLVLIRTGRIGSGSAAPSQTDQTLQVTVNRTGGSWHVSNVVSVGIS